MHKDYTVFPLDLPADRALRHMQADRLSTDTIKVDLADDDGRYTSVGHRLYFVGVDDSSAASAR